jgi:nucleoid DNA-binding protein
MNKSDLIDFLAENHQMSRAEARRIVGDLFGAIVKTVKGGDSVVISGFGTFRLHAREARLGVDPVSRARFQIPPVKVPVMPVVSCRQVSMASKSLRHWQSPCWQTGPKRPASCGVDTDAAHENR